MMLDCFALVALTGTECETNKIFDSSYIHLSFALHRTYSISFRTSAPDTIHQLTIFLFFFGESYRTHTHPQIMASFSEMNMSSNKKEKKKEQKKKLGSKSKSTSLIDKKRCMF